MQICKYEFVFIIVTLNLFKSQFFGEIYKRQDIEDTAFVPFEGRQYRLIKTVDNYMKVLYGDYMMIPPEDKREHHVVYELDLGERG